jgi:hypothetical protein
MEEKARRTEEDVRGEFFDDVRLFFSPSNQVMRSGMGWLSFLDTLRVAAGIRSMIFVVAQFRKCEQTQIYH